MTVTSETNTTGTAENVTLTWQYQAIDPVYNIPAPVVAGGVTFQVREIPNPDVVKHAQLIQRMVQIIRRSHPDVARWREINVADLLAEHAGEFVVTLHAGLTEFIADATGRQTEDPELRALPTGPFVDLAMECLMAQAPSLRSFFGLGGRVRALLDRIQGPAPSPAQPPSEPT